MKLHHALFAIAFTTAGAVPASAGGAFDGFGGRWAGQGMIRMANGQQEKMKCVATYFPSGGGTKLAMNVRCASSGLKIDVKGALQAFNDRILGTFEERNYENRGTVSGTAGGGRIDATVHGDNWLASLAVEGHGARVVMTPHSGPVKIASFTFRKD